MAKEEMEAILSGYEAWNRGDYEAVLEMLDPEIEWQFPEGGLNTGTLHGREAVRKFFESFAEAFEELRVEPEEIFEKDDRIVAIVRLVGRGRGSGAEVQVRPAHVWTTRAGKAVRLEVFPERDRERALEETRGSQREAREAGDNVERLRAVLETLDIEAWSRGDVDVSILDPEVTFEDTTLPDHVGEAYRGPEGIVRATARWMEPFERLTMELERIVGTGDRLVSIHRVQSKALHTGIEFEAPVAYIWTFRDGKVVHLRSFRDPDEALAAAGFGAREVVRRQFEAFGTGDLDMVAAFWDPDIDWRAVEGAADDVGLMKGTEALRRYYEHWVEAFDELGAEVEEVIFESGERCAVAVRNWGRPRGSNAVVQGRYFVVCTVRDGRIVSGREYETRAQALESLSIEE
jgi:ketosteroid isomerase-like protein